MEPKYVHANPKRTKKEKCPKQEQLQLIALAVDFSDDIFELSSSIYIFFGRVFFV
jgi:hypothetical protein